MRCVYSSVNTWDGVVTPVWVVKLDIQVGAKTTSEQQQSDARDGLKQPGFLPDLILISVGCFGEIQIFCIFKADIKACFYLSHFLCPCPSLYLSSSRTHNQKILQCALISHCNMAAHSKKPYTRSTPERHLYFPMPVAACDEIVIRTCMSVLGKWRPACRNWSAVYLGFEPTVLRDALSLLLNVTEQYQLRYWHLMLTLKSQAELMR